VSGRRFFQEVSPFSWKVPSFSPKKNPWKMFFFRAPLEDNFPRFEKGLFGSPGKECPVLLTQQHEM
jgi:hypothetical protein